MMGSEELIDTPLHEAVRYSDVDSVTRALIDGYNPNQLGAYQWSPLHEACNNGDENIVELLLKYQGN
jgi:ankyrin repeat protein